MSARLTTTRRTWAALLLGLAPVLASASAPPSADSQPEVPAAMVAGTDERTTDAAFTGTTRSIAELVAAFGSALHAGQLDDAGEQLARLQAQLPPRSLTLWRLQAWHAHASGDASGAIALYRDIVARLPGDATAVINLAILEAGNGQAESARQRLRRLRALDTGSDRIEHAIRQVEAQLK